MNVVFQLFSEKVTTWRSGWPAHELRRRGHHAVIYGSKQIRPPRVEPLEDVTYIVHVINRAWRQAETGRIVTIADIVELMKPHGRVILDCDDDWTKMLHIQQAGVDDLTRAVHARIPEMIRAADRVTVATPQLADIYSRWAKEVVVIPNTIPESVIRLTPREKVQRIGWMGEMYVHGDDWNMLQPLARELPPLYLIGSGREAGERIRSWGARDVDTCEAIFDPRKLYGEMGRVIGAIIPLRDTPFNRGKSWSKPLEFMARGVKPVASRHAEYEALNELTEGGLPTYESPEDLVGAANQLWESRGDGSDLPDRLRASRLTMETGGGDAWEKALA